MTAVQILLERIQQGEAAALAELYDGQAGLLHAIILRILNNNTEAEDVLQEVFVQIWEKAGNYDPSLGNAIGWIVTLARNRAIDRVRSLGRKAQLLERVAKEDFMPVETPASGGTDGLIGQEKAAQVRQALAALPKEQRRAIELAFFSGLSQSEIAGALQEPLGTIKARIRRGMLQLRDLLRGTL